MGKKGWWLPGLVLLLGSCGEGEAIPEEIRNIPVQMEVTRFDRDFARAEARDLPVLKQRFPYLFPAQYSDSIWLAKMQDTLQIALHEEVGEAFPDLDTLTQGLTLFYKHVKYYFPREPVPAVVTVISDVDYRNRVILADTLLLIGLDNYLGKEHRFYEGIDRYIAAGLEPEYLLSDVASAFAKKVVPRPEDRTFLAQMIYYGKELFLKDRLLPLLPERVCMGYSEAEMQWAAANEEQIWRYFIERELLYSTDAGLAPRFLDPAPFSKFRLELDNESPGRLGRYMGWQIVRAFMDREEVSLQQLLNIPAEEIFRRANYKPKK